jgi:hypothetical protein
MSLLAAGSGTGMASLCILQGDLILQEALTRR